MDHAVRTRRIVLAAATLLLAVIVADLGDAFCDPLLVPAGTLTVTGAQEEGSETCGNVCLPDCFCCSRPLPAAGSLLFETPALIAGSIFVHPVGFSADFPNVIEHVPLALL